MVTTQQQQQPPAPSSARAHEPRTDDATPPLFEEVACYGCGARNSRPFVSANDDLTGKPGTFTFVRCNDCGLAFQNPRVHIAHIKSFYDDEYIAHRKKTDW